MQVVVSILVTLLVFTFIVTVHEGGHFFMARRMGIFVEEFSIGMGPALFKRKTKKDLLFSVRLLPIGGFCSMKGEEPSAEKGAAIESDSFSAKKPWQRALVVAAGPVMNFILAFVLLLIFHCLTGYTLTTITQVEEDYPAYEAGLREGDQLIALNGERLYVYDKVSFALLDYQPGDIAILRVKHPDGSFEDLSMSLKLDEEAGRYRMGFAVSGSGDLGEVIQKKGFFGAVFEEIKMSFLYLVYDIEMTIRSLGMLIAGKVGLDAMTGPIGMVSIVGQVTESASQYGFLTLLASLSSLTVLISANLGVLNLFPIPGLDGSRLVFLLVEKLRGRPMNPKAENVIYLIGFVLLFGLMILVAFNDILRLFR